MSRFETRPDNRDGLKVLTGRQPMTAAIDLGAAKVGCFIMKPDGAIRSEGQVQVAGVAHVRGCRCLAWW